MKCLRISYEAFEDSVPLCSVIFYRLALILSAHSTTSKMSSPFRSLVTHNRSL